MYTRQYLIVFDNNLIQSTNCPLKSQTNLSINYPSLIQLNMSYGSTKDSREKKTLHQELKDSKTGAYTHMGEFKWNRIKHREDLVAR
jgi:hypothetical protein